MGTYDRLGVKRIINCFDTYTLLGGHTMLKATYQARDEADQNFAWIWDLEKKAGERIVELTKAPAAFVPVGVYAGMAQCVAALMVGIDPVKMRRLPDTSEMKNEVIMQKCLRDFQYDHSIEITGAKIVEVGDEKKGCTIKQLESAINEKTLAIHYMSHGTTGSYASKECKWLTIEEVIKIGKRHNIPVLVDAAFQCYPLDGFTKYMSLGADAALYSCKYFGGPNTAGILLGKKDLVDAVALHSFIGQEGASLGKEFLSEAQRGAYGSLFRGSKQDRGSIVGAVVALEEYMKIMKNPEDNVLKPAREIASYLMKQLEDIPKLKMEVMDASWEGVDLLKIALKITLLDKTVEQVKQMRSILINGSPEIWVELKDNSLIINITSFRGLMMFDDSDKKIIAKNVKKVITSKI